MVTCCPSPDYVLEKCYKKWWNATSTGMGLQASDTPDTGPSRTFPLCQGGCFHPVDIASLTDSTVAPGPLTTC